MIKKTTILNKITFYRNEKTKMLVIPSVLDTDVSVSVETIPLAPGSRVNEIICFMVLKVEKPELSFVAVVEIIARGVGIFIVVDVFVVLVVLALIAFSLLVVTHFVR